VLNPWDPGHSPGDRFYHELVMAAGSVLDVGCGTGAMLACARQHGHRGRLAGLDPDRAALARARRRADAEWTEGRAAQAAWDAEFDLAVMTGHAFQCLVADDDLRASLAAIRQALRPGGRFAFETRHPQARAWEGWDPARGSEVTDPAGRRLRVWHEVESVGDTLVLPAGHPRAGRGDAGRAGRVSRAPGDRPATGAPRVPPRRATESPFKSRRGADFHDHGTWSAHIADQVP
jgi:SAM-dependent methyltransferase